MWYLEGTLSCLQTKVQMVTLTGWYGCVDHHWFLLAGIPWPTANLHGTLMQIKKKPLLTFARHFL